MARTPEGPAVSKPLVGLTDNSNLSAPTEYDLLQIPEEELYAASFEDWLDVRKMRSYEAVVPHPYFDAEPDIYSDDYLCESDDDIVGP